jgi:putative ATP-dependent endonuclease of OLD family
VKKVLGLSLDELGISLVNIRSTGFKNVALLFHERRIRKRCAIITDLDEAFFDITPDQFDSAAAKAVKDKARGSQTSGLQRQALLQEFVAGNPWLSVHFAPHTFEVDFIACGNLPTVVGVLGDIYVDVGTIAQAKAELESNAIDLFGTRTLAMAKYAGKGWFAIQVAKLVDGNTRIPPYIVEAIFAAHRPPSDSTLAGILNHRLNVIVAGGLHDIDDVLGMHKQVKAFRAGDIDRAALRQAMLAAFPADSINTVLAHV